MDEQSDTNTVLLLVPVLIVLLISAALPAYLIWLTAPPLPGVEYYYVRLAAAMTTAIIGAFLGSFIMRMAVDITRDVTNGH